MLLMEKPEMVYDLSRIKPGDLVYARHCTWDSGRAGFVTSAGERQLIVQYHPGIGNVTNHFRIPVEEVAEGQWKIRWSSDLSAVFEYGTAPEEEKNTEEEDESGGTDL